jgi:uncharacterized integral membrane protein
MLFLRILLVTTVVLVGLVFHSRNHQPVVLDFYFRTIEIPLSWALVGALATGALCGVLVLTPRVFWLQRAVRRARRNADLALTTPLPNTPTGGNEP